MKLRGGYSPRIAGRPSHIVEEFPLPARLTVALTRPGANYAPLVATGDSVKLGTALAEAQHETGSVYIPSPSAGKVAAVTQPGDTGPAAIAIETGGDAVDGSFQPAAPDRVTADAMRETLTRAGVWPSFWSSETQGMPPVDGSERPRAIIVNCLSAEPFLARGDVILSHSWARVISGLKFLQRLLEDYGTIELVFTHKRHPLAQKLYRELAGDALLHFHPVPRLYPAEHPHVTRNALVQTDRTVNKWNVIWSINVQNVAAIGACLGEGIPPHRRIVAVGGPGVSEPRHLDAYIGTPLTCLPSPHDTDARILRGGLFTGEPVDVENDTLRADDAGFFYLPDLSEREFLGFVNPGFDRTSIMPCFATRLTGGADRRLSTYLRGEVRPCIACGLCEKVCPVGLLPQILHRYLYAGQIDEAQAAGLERCIDCRLCTYVCPSKIEIREQFAEAREQIQKEREEIAAAAEAAEADAQEGAREEDPKA